MDFSEPFSHSRPRACQWDPQTGDSVVSVIKHQVIVQDAASLELKNLFTCNDNVMEVEWSPDGSYLLCVLQNQKAVQVWALGDPDWRCKIEDPILGIVAALWMPDSRHLITFADFQLHLTVWSLHTGTAVARIKNPKYPAPSVFHSKSTFTSPQRYDFGCQGMHFSHSGRYLAVAERKDSKDHISIYSVAKAWRLAKKVDVDTRDMYDFMWSPDDSALCVWDTPLMFKLVMISLKGNSTTSQLPKKDYVAYKDALGIKTISWSPDTQFLSVGSYDQTVRLINARTWKVEMEYQHNTNPSTAITQDTIVYEEVERWRVEGALAHMNKLDGRTTIYVVQDQPFRLTDTKPDPRNVNPKLGIGLLSWSPDAHYFCTRNDSTPHALYIWNACNLSLATVLLQRKPITNVRWDPNPDRHRLALCTSGGALYMWTPDAAACCPIPIGGFKATDLQWSPDGTALLLIDSKCYCCCYLLYDDEQAESEEL